MDGTGSVVLQVPEVCKWNPYVELTERHLTDRGVLVLRPGLCRDGLFVPPFSPPAVQRMPNIIHLHWPEKLVAWYGADRALAVLQDFAERGTQIVQTVHNLEPHEPNAELIGYLHKVDALSSGVHFFSAEHELQARAARPKLPQLRTLMPHPRFPILTPLQQSSAPGNEVVLGCFGRIRPYKRFPAFARIFGQLARPGFRLLIAGAADTTKTHTELQLLARTYSQIEYLAGFLPEQRFFELLSQVQWVALPRKRVFSSGLLIAATQVGRRVLAPTPTGVDAYGLRGMVETVDPWNDVAAVCRWMDVACTPPPTVSSGALPTWDTAADHLIDFYAKVIAHGRART